MKIGRKIPASIVLLSSLISAFAIYLPVMAESQNVGRYELILLGDATGFYYMCEMFRDFKVKNLQFSTTVDSYVPTTINVNVKNLEFGAADKMAYQLSINGLMDFSVTTYGLEVLYVQCGNGDFDFMFSKNYHSLDLYGVLQGSVLFGIFIPGLEEYEYAGPYLMIHIHIGNPPLLGDINKDGKVDFKDLGWIAKAFGLSFGDIGYKLNLDLDFNGSIDMKDLGLAARNFGRVW